MNITLSDVREGDTVAYWFDEGGGGRGMLGGVKLVYCTVLKVCPKRLRVRNEFGNEALKSPDFFYKHYRAKENSCTASKESP